MAADEPRDAVHYNDLAVITEVDLKAVQPAAACGERFDLHTASPQLVDVAGRKRVTADTVIQHEDFHALGGFLQQQRLQPASEVVVVNDEKLHEHDPLCC